ncbi:response regulator transcription factor [Nonomuraea rubra]|uniref:response regulator n=1 Tax=Nonomuraea rubra TaxID=46180 RepID=UPI0036228109
MERGFPRPAGIRIVIVDEHTLLREVLGEVLLAEDDFCVTADSADFESSVALIARTRPDIVLIDIDKPHGSPGGVVRRLREASPRSVVAVLSMYDDARIVQEMIRAGCAATCTRASRGGIWWHHCGAWRGPASR